MIRRQIGSRQRGSYCRVAAGSHPQEGQAYCMMGVLLQEIVVAELLMCARQGQIDIYRFFPAHPSVDSYQRAM